MYRNILSKSLLVLIILNVLFLSGCVSERQARQAGIPGAGPSKEERSDAGMKEQSGSIIPMFAEGDASDESPAATTASSQKTPVKMVAEATEPQMGTYQINNIDGIGNWNVEAKLNERIEFWNVGEAGGEKYAEAIYTQTWIPIGNGRIVTEVWFNKALNKTVWHREDSKNPPDIQPKVERLRFSGGTTGTFHQLDGSPTKLKISSDGSGGYIITGANLAMPVLNSAGL